MEKIVSIIVPTLNEEKFIKKTLQALDKQSVERKKYEIIVSDSSSTDKTVKIAKALANKVVVCKRHSAGYGRNAGAKKACGKYLAFVDADTIVSREYVQGVIEALNKGVAATGPISSLDGEHKIFMKWWSVQDRLSIYVKKPIFPGFNFAARKKEFFSVKGMSEKDIVCEDIEVAWKLQKKGKIIWENKMKVKTSTRRISENGVWSNVKNAWTFALQGKTESWKEHRKDF